MSYHQYPIEFQILIACCDKYRSTEVKQQLLHLLPDVNWSYLIELADLHGMTALAYWHLKQLDTDLIPTDVCSKFSESFLANSQRNLQMTGILFEILKNLRDAKVTAVPFKGPLLALQAYDNISLRQFGDLDILVRPDSVPLAKGCLESLGFASEIRLSDKQLYNFISSQHELVLYRESDEMTVELHWHLKPRYFYFPLETDDVLNRTVTVQLQGRPVPSLGKEDLLLYLCAHGTKHLWERLEWLAGVSAIAETFDRSNWELFLERTKELSAERIVCLSLRLCHKLFEANYPEFVQTEVLSDGSIDKIVERIEKQYLLPEAKALSFWKNSLYFLRLHKSAFRAAGTAARCAFTPTVLDLKGASESVYARRFLFLYRPLRLAFNYRKSEKDRVQT